MLQQVTQEVERVKAWLFEPGPIKTPIVAVSGWFTWSAMKGILEGVVLMSTAVIVVLHAITAVMRRLCKRRFTGNCDACKYRPLGPLVCPRGLGKEEEQ